MMRGIDTIRKWFEKPVRFAYIGIYLQTGTKMLDVGCGTHAPYSTFAYYSKLVYSGIDWNDIEGKKDMEYFFQCDLEDNTLSEIQDNYYDVITLSHIIEHVANGEKLITSLISKLKPNGVIYIETPSEKSLRLPSWYGTLNFYDDPTHKRLYMLSELKKILEENNCVVFRLGIRRSLKRILLSPLYILSTLMRDKRVNATALWDITGFAHYVLAKKREPAALFLRQ
ncbi:MAG TPA: class I SAM-dependent methyltransferase [Candidatus Paceibacterota bacterium]|nr:class I SAM-dependent methyltransferase [Candidatus Paceibacterota bacterium]